mmetsp:Transcript_15046/g.43463  ORF Transcript_15046/g.43463 Transcript_15046/m.43463 type:complete len:472 (+) Transcript_15046:838-2253(+)
MLEGLLRLLPRTQCSGPLVVLGREPRRDLKILHTLRQLLPRHPFCQVLLAGTLRLPLEGDVVEALVLAGDAEVCVGGRERLYRQIRNASALELRLLLLLRQLHNHVLILLLFFIGVVVRRLLLGARLGVLLLGVLLLGLLLLGTLLRFRLVLGSRLANLLRIGLLSLLLVGLKLSLRLLGGLLSGQLGLPLGRLGLGLLPLLLEALLLDPLDPLSRRVAHHNHGHPLELGPRVVLQHCLPAADRQVLLHLHHDQVPWHHRRYHCERPVQTVVVHVLQPELELRLVVVRPLAASVHTILQATLGSPVEECSVADLCEVPVLSQELVEPLEGSLVRQADWHQHLVLAIFRRSCGLFRSTMAGGRFLEGQALEWQGPQRVGPKVDLQGDIPVGHRWVQGLALQTLGQRLRLRYSLPVAEQADGVGVRAGRVEVQEHRHDLPTRERLRRSLPIYSVREEPLAVEGHAAFAVTQQQ